MCVRDSESITGWMREIVYVLCMREREKEYNAVSGYCAIVFIILSSIHTDWLTSV